MAGTPVLGRVGEFVGEDVELTGTEVLSSSATSGGIVVVWSNRSSITAASSSESGTNVGSKVGDAVGHSDGNTDGPRVV